VSTPTDSPFVTANRDPVQEARAYLELAVAALDRLREVLPPPTAPRPETGDGVSA
jgi:hypothetical protein